ncbi:MAG TPA: hypothetical protein VJT81_06710 [Burkholderiales bacterium]|nr:hypothetical protein [Burkholderiales bacterium]
MNLCDVENVHLVVLDTFEQLTRKPRTVPGDCYCARCQQPVQFWFNDGQPTPVAEPAA